MAISSDHEHVLSDPSIAEGITAHIHRLMTCAAVTVDISALWLYRSHDSTGDEQYVGPEKVRQDERQREDGACPQDGASLILEAEFDCEAIA